MEICSFSKVCKSFTWSMLLLSTNQNMNIPGTESFTQMMQKSPPKPWQNLPDPWLRRKYQPWVSFTTEKRIFPRIKARVFELEDRGMNLSSWFYLGEVKKQKQKHFCILALLLNENKTLYLTGFSSWLT